jgi:hypothetical protein
MSGTELAEDETTITEITIQPDGRIYVFGTSRQVLDVLADLDPRPSKLNTILATAKQLETAQTKHNIDRHL